MNITTLSAQQLRRAADLKERIDQLQSELDELLAGEATTPVAATRAPSRGGRKRRRLSAQGLANIRAGVAKRMARQGAKASADRKPRRKMSAAGKARLAALAKARWAKAKKAGRTRL